MVLFFSPVFEVFEEIKQCTQVGNELWSGSAGCSMEVYHFPIVSENYFSFYILQHFVALAPPNLHCNAREQVCVLSLISSVFILITWLDVFKNLNRNKIFRMSLIYPRFPGIKNLKKINKFQSFGFLQKSPWKKSKMFSWKKIKNFISWEFFSKSKIFAKIKLEKNSKKVLKIKIKMFFLKKKSIFFSEIFLKFFFLENIFEFFHDNIKILDFCKKKTLEKKFWKRKSKCFSWKKSSFFSDFFLFFYFSRKYFWVFFTRIYIYILPVRYLEILKSFISKKSIRACLFLKSSVFSVFIWILWLDVS